MSGTTTPLVLIPFTPTNAGPFQFSATLDGNPFTCTVTWALWPQRWYLNIFTSAGALVLATALIASPPGVPINLVFGYFFTSTLVFWDATQSFQVTP